MKHGRFLRITIGIGLLGAFGSAEADETGHWNEVALETIRAERTPPPRAARALAIMHTAMFDAINAIDRSHVGYAYRAGADPACLPAAAAARAARDVLATLYPARAATYDAELVDRLAQMLPGTPRDQGVAVGGLASATLLALRANDGHDLPSAPYTGSTAQGRWRPTPPSFANGVLPRWGEVRPFAMPFGTWARPAPPPTLDSPEYQAALEEVRDLGRADSSRRSADQTDIALFWADAAGTATPPGHWNRIARNVAAERGLSLHERARTMALLNLALADAAIASWDAKYVFEFWRPITPLQIDDPSWSPLITTPAFPAYTSGHSTFSGAAASVLAGLFGDETTFSDAGEAGTPARAFARFSEAAREAGMSRIYGGIHWQFDNTAGLAAGARIGDHTLTHYLNPVPEPGTWLAVGAGILACAGKRRAR